MGRTLIAATLAILGLVAPAHSDEDDPVFQRKPLSAWLELLRGGKDRPGRLAAPHVLGSPGGLGIVWAGPLNNRRAALLAIELIGPSKSKNVMPAVTAALRDDPAERIREAAAQALGRMCVKARAENMKIDSARDSLINALRADRSGRVREAAATALARLDAEAVPAVAALAAALGDTYPGVRTAAASALRRLGKDARDALPELQKTLRDPNSEELARLQAALALGRIGGAEAVPALNDCLADPAAPAEIRKAAADALGMIGADAASASRTLGAALTEPSAGTELRRAAAAALDQLGPAGHAAIPALKKALKDSDRFVRCLAMHAVGRMPRELGNDRREVVTLLLQGLDDGVTEVRVAAIETLGALGPSGLDTDLAAVRDRLKASTQDSQKAVRETAVDALKKLTTP